MDEKQEHTMGMLAHLASLAGYLIPIVGNIVGPMVVWMMKKDESEFVDHHGKESLNFQITVSIALVICFVLCFVLIGFFLLPVVGIGALVLMIIAAIKANNGERYEYPFSIRFVK